jgi:hypothetical protein
LIAGLVLASLLLRAGELFVVVLMLVLAAAVARV